MRKMRILVAGKNNQTNYVNAVNGVGAEAVPLDLPEPDTNYDGLILCGGGDVDPAYYGEEMNGSVNPDRARDEAEFAVLKAFVEAGKPVLGICRGHQLINIFFGGTLHQHLPESELHVSRKDFVNTHPVTAEADSVLGRLYGTSFTVNSSHHQNVKVLADSLRPTAYWDGRYIEAFEHTSLPILGVQWHPERLCFEHKRPDTIDGAAFFQYFIRLCANEL